MPACPRCGTQNPETAAICVACGAALPSIAPPARPGAPAGASGGAGMKSTMLGMAPPELRAALAAATSAGAAPAPAPALTGGPGAAPVRLGTMIGMASPFAAPTIAHAPPAPERGATTIPAPGSSVGAAPQRQGHAPEAPAARPFKQTMMGFAAPPAGVAPGGGATPPAAPPTPPAQDRRGLSGTMMYTAPAGVGAPTPAQATFGPSTLASPALASPGSPVAVGPAPPGQQNQPGFQKTMLGVARPGIAPLEAGRVKDSDRPPPPAVIPPAPREPIAAAAKIPAAAPGPVSPRAAPPRGLPRGALVLVVVAVLLGAMAGVVALLWDAPRPLTAEVILDERGKEALSIACGDCPDGTLVTTEGGKATLKDMKAVLPLTRPLEVGSNVVAVGVQRPGLGRDEDVKLQVPVDFRVRGDLSPLSEDPPRLKVLVQAAPGGAAVVEGKAVLLDPAGKGEHAVEVGRELEGPADGVVPFERKLAFSITPPGGAARTGEVTLRFGIVPLRVDAPGDAIIIEGETFMLSGRTLSEGRITVSGRPITVDAAGRFAQLMNVSSEGETTVVVRAEAKDQAPRLVRVRVKRVTSLEEHAATFRQNAVSDYAVLVGSASPGQAVALEGEVVEARVDGEVTLLLLEAKEGCASAPCLAKVVYGSKLDAARGSTLSAFGRLRGLVDGPRTGVRIPELTAEFVVPDRTRAGARTRTPTRTPTPTPTPTR